MKRLIATLATVLALVAVPLAGATSIYGLADLGYSVTNTDVGGGCHVTTADGFGSSWSGNTCNDGYQAGLDGFAAGHDERKLGFQHPAAVSARSDLQGKGYAVSTDYAGPSFHVSGGCNVDSTTDSAGIAALDASLPTAAPCSTTPAPPAAAPPAPAPPTTGCDVQCQIDKLQAQLDALKQDVALMQRQLALLIQLQTTIPGADPLIVDALLATVQAKP